MEVVIDMEVQDYLRVQNRKNLLVYLHLTKCDTCGSELPEIQVKSLKIVDSKIDNSHVRIIVNGINVFVEKNLSSNKILRIHKILSIPCFLTVIGVITES